MVITLDEGIFYSVDRSGHFLTQMLTLDRDLFALANFLVYVTIVTK